MKKIAFFLILISNFALAQVPPQGINYQAAVRNSLGDLLANRDIEMEVLIREDSALGTIVYHETHTLKTNSQGLVSFVIGQGIIMSGDFGSINWGAAQHFAELGIDPAMNGSFDLLGVFQLMSVPYALHAATADSVVNGGAGGRGPIGPTGAAGTSGLHCWDLNGNGVADTVEDRNGDLSWDALDCMGPTGATGSGGSGFTHYVGEAFGGGVVFHVYKDANGMEHGLIVALDDVNPPHVWSNITGGIGVTAQSSWDGDPNSTAIVNQGGHSSSAADLCIKSTAGGQTDWYLPSIQELNKLWANLYDVHRAMNSIGGSTEMNSAYWSSTEQNPTTANAWSYSFYNGGKTTSPKTTMLNVRAIRKF